MKYLKCTRLFKLLYYKTTYHLILYIRKMKTLKFITLIFLMGRNEFNNIIHVSRLSHPRLWRFVEHTHIKAKINAPAERKNETLNPNEIVIIVEYKFWIITWIHIHIDNTMPL